MLVVDAVQDVREPLRELRRREPTDLPIRCPLARYPPDALRAGTGGWTYTIQGRGVRGGAFSVTPRGAGYEPADPPTPRCRKIPDEMGAALLLARPLLGER